MVENERNHALEFRLLSLDLVPAEASNDGDVSVVTGGVADLLSDHFDGHEVVVRGRGEARLNDVDAQVGQLPRDAELLLRGHGGAGRLLSVAEGGVQNADVGGVRNVMGEVLRASAWSGAVGGH
ncbi:hypothetical protein LR48_Vigan03g168900 [Vigna angularis]|uniref:Uncharacterized protein n=1 Tax=Phaseolus angularis TaxID=3914 RepID=A0A0L9U6K4_PHAAN|nr:hypothetical protein LR48_Vigan03g168900 [Vigna angularis]